MKLFVLVALTLISFSTEACRVSVLGDQSKLISANSIFEGIIIGVNLDYLENALKDTTGEESPVTFIGGGSLEHTVSIFVTETQKGNIKENSVIKATTGGCGVAEAKLKDTGMFYFFDKDNYVIPIYNKDNQSSK